MENINYFQRCRRKTTLLFYFGVSLVVLMTLFISLQLRGLIGWGGLAFAALLMPGVSLTLWGLRIHPVVRRAHKILTAEFPADFRLPDLLSDHDLQISPIGAMIRGDHLFILHRNWYGLINLQTVTGLYVTSGGTRVQAWDELVIDTRSGHRFHWMLPPPKGLAADGIPSSQAAEAGLQLLFAYLAETFPHIRLGRVSAADPRSGDPESLRNLESPDIWKEFNRSWYRMNG